MWYNKIIESFKVKPLYLKIIALLRLVSYVIIIFFIGQKYMSGSHFNPLVMVFIGLILLLDGIEKFKTNRKLSLIYFICGLIALLTVYLII